MITPSSGKKREDFYFFTINNSQHSLSYCQDLILFAHLREHCVLGQKNITFFSVVVSYQSPGLVPCKAMGGFTENRIETKAQDV